MKAYDREIYHTDKRKDAELIIIQEKAFVRETFLEK